MFSILFRNFINNSNNTMVNQLNTIAANIKLIEELGNKILPFSEMVIETGEITRSIKVLKGNISVTTLVRDRNFTVTKAILDTDTIMDWHKHSQTETIIVCDGSIIIECCDGIKELFPTESYTIKPEILHKVFAKEKTTTITILIPAEEIL